MSIRLRQICLVAEKLALAIEDFKAVLGLEVCFKDPDVAVFGLENSLFPVGNNFIEVVAPVKENTAAGRYLKQSIENGYDNGREMYTMTVDEVFTHMDAVMQEAKRTDLLPSLPVIAD